MIDAHVHLWNPKHLSYPWLNDYQALNREFDLSAYHLASAGSGIDSGIFVECSAGEDSFLKEAQLILQLAADPKNKISGVIASVWAERADFIKGLDSLEEHPALKGLRRVLHTEPDALSQSLLFRENLKVLGKRGLTFDLCLLERQLHLGIELADACSGVQFILDHCGNPDIASGSMDNWRRQISEFSKRPNVACKISGIILNAPEMQRNSDGLYPWFSHVIECFGWNRVIWGGDWPVCTLARSLGQWVNVTNELLGCAKATPEQRNALLDLNAKTFYKL